MKKHNIITILILLGMSFLFSGCTRNLWIDATRNDTYDLHNNNNCKLLMTKTDSRIAINDDGDIYITDVIIKGFEPSMQLNFVKIASVYGNVDNGEKMSFQLRFDVKTVDNAKIIPVKFDRHYIDCGMDSVYAGSCKLDKSNSEQVIEIGKIKSTFELWRNRSNTNKALRISGAVVATPVTVAVDVVIVIVAVPLYALGVPLGLPWPSDAH